MLGRLGLLCAVALLYSACGKSAAPAMPLLYDTIPVQKPVVPLIAEASGIADSRKNPGMLWVEEDSGNPSQLYLLGHDGIQKKKIHLLNILNRDWEDIQLSGDKIYLADIGDNNAGHAECIFYVFDEPSISTDTVTQIESIRFVYADGPRDAEAFLVDPVKKDIYIITKRDNPSRVYKISYPYNAGGLNTATQVGVLTYTNVVSAALSANGKEMLVKTYAGIQHYDRSGNESIGDALKKKPTLVAYKMEPQGEAICFALDGSGFFTLSEKGFASAVNLFFYRRK